MPHEGTPPERPDSGMGGSTATPVAVAAVQGGGGQPVQPMQPVQAPLGLRLVPDDLKRDTTSRLV